MKNFIQTLVLILLVSNIAFSQANYETWSWANEYGVPNDWNGNEKATGVTTDSEGNIYTTGVFTHTFNIGTFTLENDLHDWAIFIIKHSPTGEVLWANSYGATTTNNDESKGMVIDADNNFYISGGFTSDLDFGNDVVLTHTNGTSYDAYIAKFNSDGVAQWAVSVNSEFYSWGKGIAIDETGIYFTGDFEGDEITIGTQTLYNQSNNTADYDGYFAKYDLDGNFIFAKSFSGNFDEWIFDISVGNGGEIAIVGKYGGTPGAGSLLDFGNDITLSHAMNSFQELFIVKYDASGNALWAKTADYSDNEAGESAESVAIDDCGNVYVTGDYSAETISFDGFSVTNTAFGNITDIDLYWVKFNKDGETQWLGAQGNGKAGHVGGITLDNTQSPIVYGGVHSGGTIILGDSTYTGLDNAFYLAYTARLNRETGEVGWNEIAKNFEGANDFWYSNIEAVHVDNVGNLTSICTYLTYISGYGATFNLGENVITGFGGLDFAVGIIPFTGTLSSENDITVFEFTEQTEDAIIDNGNHTIDIEVVAGTDVSNLLPNIELSINAYSCNEFTDFTNPVTYTVIAENGIEQDWTITVTVAVGIANLSANQISIYPNPSNGIFTIQNFTNSQIQNLIITDITGKIIKQFTIYNSQFTINISNQPAGIYFLKINSNDGIYTEKIIIQ